MDNKYVFMVQVSCMTFNHSPYIVDTMNGFCMQQTSFPFVCTIFDDFSTDGEQEEIKQYVKENFDLENEGIVRNEETDDYVLTFARHKTNLNCFFAVYYLKYNHYSIGKGYRKLDYCKELVEHAPYVALCEGDDYWIDSNKLQKQVDYLESHPGCGLVYTQAQQYDQETGVIIKGTAGQTNFMDLLCVSNKVMTLTVMFRTALYSKCLKEFTLPIGYKCYDIHFWLYISKHSDIHYIDEITAVYRILKNSASHNSDTTKLAAFIIDLYEIRFFYANHYGYTDLFKDYTKKTINDLFRLSAQRNTNISYMIFLFAKKTKALSFPVLLKCLFYSTRIGRCYHRRKYPDTITMY